MFCDKGYFQQWYPTIGPWNFEIWVVSAGTEILTLQSGSFGRAVEIFFILFMVVVIGEHTLIHIYKHTLAPT